MDQLPQQFKDKWYSLSRQRGPNDQSLTTVLGDISSGILDNPNEGRRVDFKNGALLSHGFHTPPFLIYGDIHNLWKSLGEANSALGLPIADPQWLADGSTCSIFEGGHVHKPPGVKEVAFVPSDRCTARFKPTTPESLLNASPNWPPKFRDKWAALAPQRDPNDKQLGSLAGSTNFWPHGWPGLKENENGGKTLHLTSGALVSYDYVTQPFLIYGKIHGLWSDLGDVRCGLGHPLADPKYLSNGTTCSIFVGGHVHQSGMKDAEIVPASRCNAENQPAIPEAVWEGTDHWPPLFRNKWIWLSSQRNLSGKQLAPLMGPMDCWPHSWPGLTDNENGGKMLHFRLGRLISYDYVTEPFAFYGKIFEYWNDCGGLRSGLGHPLTDPQFLPDGSTCNIFEGGHVHQNGTKDPEIVPASKCIAKNKPTVPEYVTMATVYWPKVFRDKWTLLSYQRDPSGKQLATLMGPTDCWPYGWPGLTNNSNGGKMLHFREGRLISYGDTPPFLVYGKLVNLWITLGSLESGFGYPLADPQFLPDGSICVIFQGGHIHQPSASRDAEAFPADKCTAPHQPTVPPSMVNASPSWPPLFRNKWTSLSLQRDASKTQICSILGDTKPGLKVNSDGGETLQFDNGMLVSIADDTPPSVVYGKIYEKWLEFGGLKGDYGRPLCDERDLPGGGRCTPFEGGHIHKTGDRAEMTLANTCPVPVVKPRPVQRAAAAPTTYPTAPPAVPARIPVQQTAPPPAPSSPPVAPSSPPTYDEAPYVAHSPMQGHSQSYSSGYGQAPAPAASAPAMSSYEAAPYDASSPMQGHSQSYSSDYGQAPAPAASAPAMSSYEAAPYVASSPMQGHSQSYPSGYGQAPAPAASAPAMSSYEAAPYVASSPMQGYPQSYSSGYGQAPAPVPSPPAMPSMPGAPMYEEDPYAAHSPAHGYPQSYSFGYGQAPPPPPAMPAMPGGPSYEHAPYGGPSPMQGYHSPGYGQAPGPPSPPRPHRPHSPGPSMVRPQQGGRMSIKERARAAALAAVGQAGSAVGYLRESLNK